MENPLVSVIVPHHLPENKKYLDLCIESLRLQEGVPFEVIIVSASRETFKYDGMDNLKIIDDHNAKHFSQKINLGVKLSSPHSKYVLVGNDDVVYSKQTLKWMSDVLGDQQGIVNGYSNCDNGWYFHANMRLPRPTSATGFWEVPRQFAYEDFPMECLEAVYNYPTGTEAMIAVDFCAFYSTMIPKKVWDVLGGLDEVYRTGWEDRDFCYRAKERGIGSFMMFMPFIMHFGGKSIKTVTKEDQAVNEKHFTNRWAPKK